MKDDSVAWEEIFGLRNLKVFPLVDESLGEEYHRIYPLMQCEVKSVMLAVKNYNVSVIIFGSALTMKCNITSDLDVCIKSKDYNIEQFHEIQTKILKNISVNCDVIYYNYALIIFSLN